MKTIASMTSMPSRLDRIQPVIECVLAQKTEVDHLEINIPYFCLRTREEYVIPRWLRDMSRVVIFRTPDFGAITKIAPTLLRHRRERNVRIWSVDDDFLYGDYELGLLSKYFDPELRRIVVKQAIYFSEDGELRNIFGIGEVQMFEGYGGVLYPTSCIDSDFQDYVTATACDQYCRKSDDIILSFYFKQHNVSIFINNKPSEGHPFYPAGIHALGKDSDALHLQDGGHKQRYRKVLDFLTANWSALLLPADGHPEPR